MRFSSPPVAALVLGAAAAFLTTPFCTAASPPTPPRSCPSSCKISTTGGAFGSKQPAFANSASAPTILSLRGGEVLEPKTLADVDAIILKASAEGKGVVIDFSAEWCGPCKMIAPLFHDMSDEINNVVFVTVDVDENPDTAAKYSVSAMPTFVFIKSGEVVDRLMGANPARLKEMCEELA